ncbi:L-glutamate gamma-semialdehyde dehydrogenase [Alterisphingorhabdus coralli]|uniref:Bifunctional protein PutA n=1 Tax=Alterisphingorhabdus coralli TaxID=3071408 RepID=A0AA97F6H3_9SPHN|nr:L-glutamate gamma-semialdehyde dehydrogenase [Parasphingorhabdus sp. SCSIO 66989]WOE74836.1 L-glutamate gamma-semialdehyde dehydrogenase [Parasphingorhabdus sp. SCSIO 66989]
MHSAIPPIASISDARAEMRRLHRLPEYEVLAPLVAIAKTDAPGEEDAILNQAHALLADLRSAQSSGWVNQFLQEYRMSSAEGIALLALAEAFLRVPDPETADLLIADKIGTANWRSHSGKSASSLVNSATWGLVLGRAVVGESANASMLKRLINRTGEPFVRQAVGAAMRLMGEVFVMGRTIDEAMERMNRKQHKGFTASFDMLGEAARTHADAERYFEAYAGAIEAVAKTPQSGHGISVKLSALHPRYEAAQSDICLPVLIDRVTQLAEAAAKHDIAFTVDAEESERLIMSLDVIAGVRRAPSLKGWDGMGMAVQAYSKRGLAVCGWANALGEEVGEKIKVRLVKGAYWDSEIKFTQEHGLSDYPLFTRKPATDVSYLACARALLDYDHIEPAFASHNARTIATILAWAGNRRDFEFQRLHGMGDGLYERLVHEHGHSCRIYAPVGGHSDLLAYLVRRLLENGANSSFVHQLADESRSVDELLADPVDYVLETGGTRHPSIPLPIELFGPERRNSSGIDLDDRQILAATAEDMATAPDVTLPAATDVDTLVTNAQSAFAEWDAKPVEERATCLEKLADLLEDHRSELMALAVNEAKKTIPDALGEVREAVDFCRYYAAEARAKLQPIELPGPTGEQNMLRMGGRGVWGCIAPWNFPLAIFLGQVTAALVSGNCVIAKPAPQTPRIAAYAVKLAHQAGIPEAVLQLLVGGAEEGAALVDHHGIAGIAFTGSVPTGKAIARALVADDDRPIVPLIAETGGLNAMIVDSTALPEQVVRDVVISGFQSAGQRCSALRLLLLQEDIAERTLTMLKGAMDALVVGDPGDPRSDVGPVIDQAAYDKLMAYRDSVSDRIIKTIDVPEDGFFVPPTLIQLDSMDDLNTEWFGPIIHVATWKAEKLTETIHRINAKGFGLTMGLHSRVARAANIVEARAKVGNLYVNRSMIGAIVGSQPFGGEGLSGTGPKAGGPHYLPRFCAERVTSTDTTSAGGNASLLSLEDEDL